MKKLKILCICLSSVILSSCLNDDNGVIDVPQNVGKVAFINAAPGTTNLKYYANDNLINSGGTDYGNSFGYLNFEIGNYNISAGESDLNPLSLNVELNKLYSIYTYKENDTIKLISYADNLVEAEHGKAVIRFIQLSPDAPQMKIGIDGETSDLGIYNFKGNSQFMNIDPTLHIQKMYLINAETSDTIFSKNVEFEQGRLYFVYTQGFVNTENENERIDIKSIRFN